MGAEGNEPREGAAPGLRERHKHATRKALEDAALRLFARDGFDATTVEAIAAEAGVSPRTFFRYFATKEEVVAPGREQRQALLREAVLAADAPGLSDLDLAVEALVRIAPAFEADRETMALRRRAAVSSAVLRGRLQDVLSSWEETLVDALASRGTSPDPAGETARATAGRGDLEAQAAGTVAIALWQRAVQRWAADVDRASDLAAHLRAVRAALHL